MPCREPRFLLLILLRLGSQAGSHGRWVQALHGWRILESVLSLFGTRSQNRLLFPQGASASGRSLTRTHHDSGWRGSLVRAGEPGLGTEMPVGQIPNEAFSLPILHASWNIDLQCVARTCPGRVSPAPPPLHWDVPRCAAGGRDHADRRRAAVRVPHPIQPGICLPTISSHGRQADSQALSRSRPVNPLEHITNLDLPRTAHNPHPSVVGLVSDVVTHRHETMSLSIPPEVVYCLGLPDRPR